MITGNPDDYVLNLDSGSSFCFAHSLLHGGHRPIYINDNPTVQSVGWCAPNTKDVYAIQLIDCCDYCAYLCCPDIEANYNPLIHGFWC
jgi:hypothetical protein